MMSLTVLNSTGFASQTIFSHATASHSSFGISTTDTSLGSANLLSNFTEDPSSYLRNQTSSNYTRSLRKNLLQIMNGFKENFAHSFSMNERSRTHRRVIHQGVQNSLQSMMNNRNDQMKFNKVHAIPFPKGFPRMFQGPIATRKHKGTRKAITIRPKLSIANKKNSSTMPHLPVLWTALSLALGVEVRGELIRGLPCITRFNQLFCRSGGTSYPSDRIENFIDDNKALIRRMYGEFISLSVITDSLRSGRRRRSIDDLPIPDNLYFNIPNDLSYPDNNYQQSDESVNGTRFKRQASRSRSPGPLPKSDRIDSCRSEEEITTPYWASNSRGKILAIVNTNEFSQIIHQEICTKQSTKRCNGDCGCEQKYKYHRLMAYDSDNDCKGIFMDWFLFPSCCSCRCDPL